VEAGGGVDISSPFAWHAGRNIYGGVEVWKVS